MDQPTFETTGDDLWHDDYPLEQMLGLVLGRVLAAGHMDNNQTARLCLTARELAGLLPAEQHGDRAMETAEGLSVFLEESGSAGPLAGAIRDWRVTIELVRSRFGWLELPPVMRKRAHCRARVLLLAGEARGWLVQRELKWHLTEQGEAAAQAWRVS